MIKKISRPLRNPEKSSKFAAEFEKGV